MSVTKDERASISILREPQFPIGAVEGQFKGERRVFLCLMGRDAAGKLVVEAPLAMLLTEDDFKEIKNNEGVGIAAPPQQSKIILASS